MKKNLENMFNDHYCYDEVNISDGQQVASGLAVPTHLLPSVPGQ